MSALPLSPPEREEQAIELEQIDADDPLLQQNSTQSHAAPDAANDVLTSPLANARLTLFNGVALLIGSEIGSGIFSSPSQVDKNAGSPGAAVLIWLVAGLIAWSGATSFAELGAAIRNNGGMQEYLCFIYGDFLASVMSWTWIIVVRPSAMAIQGIIVADYWVSAVFGGEKVWWAEKLLAFAILAAVLTMNSISGRLSTRFTDVFLFVKLAAIALIVILAILSITINLNGDGTGVSDDWRSKDWFDTAHGMKSGDTGWDLLGHFTVALYSSLWAYSGWDQVNLVAGEMQNAARDIPRAIHTAVPTVIACFLLTNFSYYIILPWGTIKDADAIALAVGKKTLGLLGGIIFTVLVSASCLGSLNINVFTSARLTVASAERGYLPDALAYSSRAQKTHNFESAINRGIFKKIPSWLASFLHRNAHRNTPIAAIGFNGILTCFYILLGTLGGLMTFIGLAEYIFCFLTVTGCVILRWTQPQLLRPYRCPIWVPVVFSLVSLFLVVRGALAAPVSAIILAAMISSAALLHWYISQKRLAGRSPSNPNES